MVKNIEIMTRDVTAVNGVLAISLRAVLPRVRSPLHLSASDISKKTSHEKVCRVSTAIPGEAQKNPSEPQLIMSDLQPACVIAPYPTN